MPDDTAGRRGRRTVQDVDRHVGARIRECRIMLGLTQQ
jgi:transcriptional regulator with XRE-family HTH domain